MSYCSQFMQNNWTGFPIFFEMWLFIEIPKILFPTLLWGKFYKSGDKSGSNQSIWDRKSGSAGFKSVLRDGKEKRSTLSNLKTTFFTPIGTQTGYKRNKAMARKYIPEIDTQVKKNILLSSSLSIFFFHLFFEDDQRLTLQSLTHTPTKNFSSA